MLTKKSLILIVFFLLVSLNFIYGQKAILGKIYDFKNDLPLESSIIKINDSIIVNGDFKGGEFVYALATDMDTFKIEQIGYRPIYFINIPDLDSVNLGRIPLFYMRDLVYLIDFHYFYRIRSNIFLRKENRKDKKSIKEINLLVKNTVYYYEGKGYNIHIQGKYLIIDLNKPITINKAHTGNNVYNS